MKTTPFSVEVTAHCERLVKRLTRQHGELPERLTEALEILRADPYDRARRYPIKKLKGVPAGDGQYRLRLGRWRFRYDIEGQDVTLHYVGLRREDTYR